jgi:iron-sulfur cluster repair protein YtfE (RIC family)
MTAAIHPVGQDIADHLRAIHQAQRRDLAAARTLATSLVAGRAPAGAARSLRVQCVRLCQFLHAHHTAEDRLMFPALTRSAPTQAAVFARLQQDHVQLNALLHTLQAAADRVMTTDAAGSRENLERLLGRLETLLLRHLSEEEDGVVPTLQTWSRMPF